MTIIDFPKFGQCAHFLCPCCDPLDQQIMKVFYSEKHALSSGWEKTKNPTFCKPDDGYVWVCPKCVEEDDMKILNRHIKRQR